MKKAMILLACFWIILIPMFIFASTTSTDFTDNEFYCITNNDCTCGFHKKTNECFYGNNLYVDDTATCPGFCEQSVLCIENHCNLR